MRAHHQIRADGSFLRQHRNRVAASRPPRRRSVIVVVGAAALLLAQTDDPRFDRAAARWVGRLLTETPTGLRDARSALALVERLPVGQDALHGLARRAADRAARGPVIDRSITA
jgi:hypothetical protein